MAARKGESKKTAEKAPRSAGPGRPTNQPDVGKHLIATIDAVGGRVSALAQVLGVNVQAINVARRAALAGRRATLPPQTYLPMARLTGVAPADIAPAVYMPSWKVAKAKVKLTDAETVVDGLSIPHTKRSLSLIETYAAKRGEPAKAAAKPAKKPAKPKAPKKAAVKKGGDVRPPAPAAEPVVVQAGA